MLSCFGVKESNAAYNMKYAGKVGIGKLWNVIIEKKETQKNMT